VKEITFDDIKDILVNRVGLKPSDLPSNPNVAFDDLGLDSLAFVEIQLAVQQQYGFSIPDEDAHKIRTIAEAIDYTNQRIREQG
jgi:acyl carrier protein